MGEGESGGRVKGRYLWKSESLGSSRDDLTGKCELPDRILCLGESSKHS